LTLFIKKCISGTC